MRVLRFREFAVITGFVAILSGCQTLLGIDDTQLGEVDAGTDANFEVTGLPVSFNVPIGGAAEFAVNITRSTDFAEVVAVAVEMPPAGFKPESVQIAGNASAASLIFSAAAPLQIGDTFDIKLLASAGSIERRATVRGNVTGAPGSLDATFGTGGIVDEIMTSNGVTVQDIRFLSTGHIALTGSFVGLQPRTLVAKLTRDGAFETAFNKDGLAPAPFDLASSGVSVFAQEITKLTVVSASFQGGGNIAMARFDADGELDGVEFGVGGTSIADLGGDEEPYDAILSRDGENIVIAGERDGDVLLAIFDDQAGTTSSLPGGRTFTTFALSTGIDRAVAIRSDSLGRYLLLCETHDRAGNREIAILRVNSDGTLDSEYSEDGIYTIGVDTADDIAKKMELTSDNRIIVVGERVPVGGSRSDRVVVVTKLNSDSTPDSGFGNNGTAILAVDGNDVGVEDMALASDGRIILIGRREGQYVARLRADGSLDPFFGVDGFIINPPIPADRLQVVTVDGDGNILVAGEGSVGSNLTGVVARLWN